MYKRCFFKYMVFFLLAFFSWSISSVSALSPSYLFLSNNRVNTANVEMVLLITPSKDFSAGSELTISFPDLDDGKWCKQNNANLVVSGVTKSAITTQGWSIDAALPGTLSAKCIQGSGFNSFDRIVVTGISGLSAGLSYGLKIAPSGNLSTGSNVGSNNTIIVLERGFVRDVTAFSVPLQALGGVTIEAFISEDISSSVQTLDSSVEKGLWSRIRVRVLSSKGQPIPGRTIRLALTNVSNLTNWEIEQPVGVTNSNGFVEGRIRGFENRVVGVRAIDKSLSKDIDIKSTALVSVTNVPTITLHSLSFYTSGLTRKVTWNPLGSSYEYQIEASLDPNFTTVLRNTGWISQNEYTFENLEHGKVYYYRGKARNIVSVESTYSNIVSSIQADAPAGVVEVLDPSVEVGVWARVRVRVVDSQGNPISGRRVEFRIDAPNMAKWTIEQPSSLTDSNGVAEGRIRGLEVRTVKVTAVDKTMSQDQLFDGFGWLQVTQLPSFSLHSLPTFSKGLSRQITWNSLGSNYEYYIEISSDSNFARIIANSGWLSLNQFVFSNLVNEQTYFYRGKVRNPQQQESSYSEIVSGTQDDGSPAVEKMEFVVMSVEGEKKVRFIFLVKDFSKVSSVNFRCKDSKNILYPCGSLSSSGNFHSLILTESELSNFKTNENNYLLRYCLQARDIVGNESDSCAEETFNFEEVKIVPKEEEAFYEEEDFEETELENEDVKLVEGEVERETFFTRMAKTFAPVQQVVQKGVENSVIYIQDLNVNDERIGTTSVAVVSTVAPATLFSVLFNPANFATVGHAFVGLVGVFRRKKKSLPYGYIYDAVTKEPINKAIVRIYSGKRLIRTTVSDIYGVFTADLEPGEYSLNVVANGYIYPSKLITASVDGILENIYRGGKFLIAEESQIRYAIPLDPIDSSNVKYTKTVIFNNIKNIFNALQKIFVVLGFLIAFFLYIRTPDTFNLAILLFYIPLLFLHLLLSFGSKRYNFGVVRDQEGAMLSGVELGLRELEFEKLIAKRVTDEKGRYKFLVPGSEYRLEVLTSGYKIKYFKEKEFIFKGNIKKPLLVSKSFVLEKEKKS